jgi:PhnB protein
MKSAHIYLTFDGNCKEAFEFYHKVLGGTLQISGTFADIPPGDDGQPAFPEDQHDRLMHVTLSIGNDIMIFGSDTGGEWSKTFIPGNNFSISLDSDSKEEAESLFESLSEGGHVIMPMGNTFWNSYYGMCVDKFGVQWMISFDMSS